MIVRGPESQAGGFAAILAAMTAADASGGTRGWWRFAPIAAIACALALFLALRLDRHVTLDRLVESHVWLRSAVDAHWLTAVVVFIAVYAASVAISAPGATILTLAAGAVFGMVSGAMASVVGATLGACVLFLAARTAIGPWLAHRAGPRLARLREGFCADAPGYMLFLRFSPLFPFWFVNLAAACGGVAFPTFLWTTIVGILPASFVFAAAGASLDRIVLAAEAGRQACRAAGSLDCGLSVPLSAILGPQVFAALIGLSLLALAPIALRRWNARNIGAEGAR